MFFRGRPQPSTVMGFCEYILAQTYLSFIHYTSSVCHRSWTSVPSYDYRTFSVFCFTGKQMKRFWKFHGWSSNAVCLVSVQIRGLESPTLALVYGYLCYFPKPWCAEAALFLCAYVLLSLSLSLRSWDLIGILRVFLSPFLSW